MKYKVCGSNSLEELLEHKDDIICYTDCDSMEDVAAYYIEETGILEKYQQTYKTILIIKLLGRNMEIEGNYLVTSHGVFEYVR